MRRGSSMVSLPGLGKVAAKGTLAAAVVVGLALGGVAAVPASSRIAEPAVAVTAAEDELTATAASHPKKPPKKRRHRGIGDAPCDSEPVDRPTIELSVTGPPFQLGVPFDICIKGFATGEPIQVVVTRPNGSQRSAIIQPDPDYDVQSYLFLAYPPDPLGLYRVVATQGSRTATQTFTVSPAPTWPRFATLLFEVRAGQSVPFVLAGFDPGEKVAIFLYRQVGVDQRTSEAIYRRARHAARSIRANQQGFALGKVTMRRGGHHLVSVGALCCGRVRVR